MENEILDYINRLFMSFNYWSIGIVCTTFIIMLLVAWIIRLIFKKINPQKNPTYDRIRKTITQVLTFCVSAVVITIFLLIKKDKSNLNANFVLINAIPCGGCSMLIWAVIKVIRDCGGKSLFAFILHCNDAKKLLNKIPLDTKIKNTIYSTLCHLVKNTDGKNAEIVISKAVEITEKAEQMLIGFTDNPHEMAVGFLHAIQKKFNKGVKV